MFYPIFLTAVFVIVWLSGALFVEDIRKVHATERRLARAPNRVR